MAMGGVAWTPAACWYIGSTPAPLYTLSLHDALPIFLLTGAAVGHRCPHGVRVHVGEGKDRKSTRLNSSHLGSSYAVFCLKKKDDVRLQPHLADHVQYRPFVRFPGRDDGVADPNHLNP